MLIAAGAFRNRKKSAAVNDPEEVESQPGCNEIRARNGDFHSMSTSLRSVKSLGEANEGK